MSCTRRWQCHVCTFLHQFPNIKCAMCHTPRTTASSISDVSIGGGTVKKRRSRSRGSSPSRHPKNQRKSQIDLSEGEIEILCVPTRENDGTTPKEIDVIDLTETNSPIWQISDFDESPSQKSRTQQTKAFDVVGKVTPSLDATTAAAPSLTTPDSVEDRLQNETDDPLTRPSQSAYLQHLAEICATILLDERWRGIMSREAGDDLRAVIALARFEERETDESGSSSNFPVEEEKFSMKEYEEEARAMLLYSRMFVRKGPWFRLDDLLKYYCSPRSFFALAAEDTGRTDDATAQEAISQGEDYQEERVQRNSVSVIKRADLQSMPYDNNPVKVMFQDINYLLSKGLIRSFLDERECGIVVGNNKTNGGILTVEERNILLRKLGCGPQKRNGGSALGSVTPNEARCNKVIIQMRSQKPLFFQMLSAAARTDSTAIKSDGGSQGCIFLPVRRHVESIIRNSIFDKSDWPCQSNKNCTPPLCIRLTEKPLQCVRRCVRLFLIAGGGPGSMRESGWLSVLESPIKPCISEELANRAFSSALPTWSTISYPGLQHRLKLKTFFFQRDYKKLRYEGLLSLPTTLAYESKMTIFHGGVPQFHCWELACEIRAHVSYLIEINQLNESMKRREQKRQSSVSCAAETSSIEIPHSVAHYNCLEDSLNVLQSNGREALLRQLLQDCNLNKETVDIAISKVMRSLDESVEVKSEDKAKAMLTATVYVIVNVLRARISFLPSVNVAEYLSRPWLRHFQVEGIFAYCLWDAVEIFEKNGRYALAVELLLLITGLSMPSSCSTLQAFGSNNDLDSLRQAFVQLLLSRRSRGKALERLVIDLMHLLRQEAKELRGSNSGLQKKSSVLCEKEENHCDHQKLFFHLLGSVGSTVPFSSFRALAKRLNCPLKDIIDKIPNMEVNELQLRLENDDLNSINNKTSLEEFKTRQKASNKNINGWCPIADISVANSIKSEKGTRCTFVGWEDETEATSSKFYRSLSVEELALEEYLSGRLPNNHAECIEGPCGGWIGWHDEGGHIRALFRILCCPDLLGSKSVRSKSPLLYLTPYQSSPLDLHVAAQGLPVDHSTGVSNDRGSPVQSFYYQRKDCIDEFLDKIAEMSQDDLCDVVYGTIKRNMADSESKNDVVLMRDACELRKLSLIAAGIGGRLLSAIFRCLCYDYRHYCAGMPDLILSRALYHDSATELVDLIDWVGEDINFGTTSATETGSILSDRDDDFLGCSMSDSLVLSNQWNRKSRPVQPKHLDTQLTNLSTVIPEKLQLTHNNRKIKVQCMFVEVKSSNDRLDGRQQDWLNILDKFGYARVCKFEKSSNK